MTQIVVGPFSARNLGAGSWTLTSTGIGATVHLRGAGPDASFPSGAAVAELAVAWRSEGVEITVTTAQGSRVMRAESAIIHEPNPRLYDSLSLPDFDAAARSFWKRVFLLMRIPGGRSLLGLVARRRPGRQVSTKN